MQDSPALLPSSLAAASLRSFDVARLFAPAAAIEAFFARVALAPPGVERLALDASIGRVLAEDAVAREDHPAHPRSTMDGFALRSGVAGEGSIAPRKTVEFGACITPRAEDVRSGETVLSAGRRLGGPELGVLATLGITRVPVFVRPRIGILSTGDELVDPERAPLAGQVRDSNRYAVAASLVAFGAQPVQIARSADLPDALRASLRAALETCDALFSTGGSSVGERDLVPRIVAEFGAPGAIVHGLRVKPGKPTLLAAVGPKPVIGLPGNPTSSLMILEAVVRPIVAALCGERYAAPPSFGARAKGAFAGRAGWTWYVPVRVRRRGAELEAEPMTIRSAQTSLLARASGYVTIEEDAAPVEAGGWVNVSLFSSGGAPIETA